MWTNDAVAKKKTKVGILTQVFVGFSCDTRLEAFPPYSLGRGTRRDPFFWNESTHNARAMPARRVLPDVCSILRNFKSSQDQR